MGWFILGGRGRWSAMARCHDSTNDMTLMEVSVMVQPRCGVKWLSWVMPAGTDTPLTFLAPTTRP